MESRGYGAPGLRHAVAVDADPVTGAPVLVRHDGFGGAVFGKVPPVHCTVTAFHDRAGRDAWLAAALEARGNAETHEPSSPDGPGWHVVLTVHHDRPVEPGTLYDEAVAYVFAERGGVPAGDGAWTQDSEDFPRIPVHRWYREVDGGWEVSWYPACSGQWLDPDLEAETRAVMARHGLARIDGFRVCATFPGDFAGAVNRSKSLKHKSDLDLERIDRVAAARSEARSLLASTSVVRMMRGMSEGRLAFWSRGMTNFKSASYQPRKGGGDAVVAVSGDSLLALYRLGAVDVLWEPGDGSGLSGCHHALAALSPAGRALLAGDVAAGTAKPRRMPCVYPCGPRMPGTFADAVAEYAAGLDPRTRAALAADIVFPSRIALTTPDRGSLAPEKIVAAFAGLVSGRARVTDAGFLVPVKGGRHPDGLAA